MKPIPNKQKTDKWKCVYCGKCFSTKDALGSHLSGEFEDLTTAVDWVVDQMEELNVKP